MPKPGLKFCRPPPPGQRRDRVARGGVNEQEVKDDDPEEEGDRLPQPPQKISDQFLGFPTRPPGPRAWQTTGGTLTGSAFGLPAAKPRPVEVDIDFVWLHEGVFELNAVGTNEFGLPERNHGEITHDGALNLGVLEGGVQRRCQFSRNDIYPNANICEVLLDNLGSFREVLEGCDV